MKSAEVKKTPMQELESWAEYADRLLRHCDYGSVADILKEKLSVVLAAIHPDDAEPVTEEWLRACGFEEEFCVGWFTRGRVQILNDSGRLDTAWVRPAAVYDQKTRGHVRRLCAALGSPLEVGQ